MDQSRDIESFLTDMDCDVSRPVAAPMPTKGLIMSDTTPLSKEKQSKYRSIVGSLNYFVSGTQWHLAHAVSRLAQFSANATVGAEKQLDQLLAWLSGNVSRRLSGPVVQSTTWDVYSDSDHAGDRDLGTRSHTGVVAMCNGVPISWRSQKQPVTSVSSAAAEIYALSEAVRDSRLCKWRAEEMGCEVPSPIEINVDNSAGVVFQTHMNPHSKLKGMIDLRWTWVKELQDSKEIRAIKVDTKLNVADLLTKCHGRSTFNYLIDLVAERSREIAKLEVA